MLSHLIVFHVLKQGLDCSEPWTGAFWGQYACVNNCTDVGVCRDGFCHCPPGRFGISCARTQVCRCEDPAA